MIAGIPSAVQADGHSGAMDVPKISSEIVLKGLENPWDMAFLPDGTMFFTEKCKGLSVRTTDGTVNALYGVKGSTGYAATGDDLFCEAQAGVLGVVPDRHFAKKPYTFPLPHLQPSIAAMDVRLILKSVTATL